MVELATELTAYAHKSNTSFPFVTMPLFEVNARHARLQSGTIALGYVPLVKTHQKNHWEKYSVENQWWIKESRELELDSGEDDGASDEDDDLGSDQLDLSDQDVPIFDYIYQLGENGLPMPVGDDHEVRRYCSDGQVVLMHLKTGIPNNNFFRAAILSCLAVLAATVPSILDKS